MTGTPTVKPAGTPPPTMASSRRQRRREGRNAAKAGTPVGTTSPSLPPSDYDDDLYVQNLPTARPPPDVREPTRTQLATMLMLEEIARLVGAGIAVARAPETSG